jgi:hypothetical protein
MINLAEELRQAAAAVAVLGSSSADLAALPDAEALAGQRRIADLLRLSNTFAAWMAATIAQRSRPELGHSGLAAQQGFLSPEALIQNWTGSSKGDAFKLVAVGTMMADTEAAERLVEAALDSPDGEPVGDPVALLGLVPWQAPIARAVTAGTLSVDAAESIRAGLGDIDAAVTADKLAAALAVLLVEARSLNVDQVFKRARRMRDELDEAGIAAREKQARDDRYLRVYRLRDGKVRLNGLFAPEDGEFVLSTYDVITGPRRGGVRFVDKEQAAWAKRMQDDPRTTEQIAADSFVELLKIAGEADQGRVFGGRRPSVRVIVTEKNLTDQVGRGGRVGDAGQVGQSRDAGQGGDARQSRDTGQVGQGGDTGQSRNSGQVGQGGDTGQSRNSGQVGQGGGASRLGQSGQSGQGQAGHGWLEGSPVPVSWESVERLLCDTGTRGIKFDDDGQCVNVGRDERLFTEKQRAGMAVRDGGCRWPGCEHPPAWTEAHHLDQWLRDNGKTDLADGVLLCSPHHLLLHNQHWEIIRTGAEYWLRPPASIDPAQTLIPMPSKNPLTLEQAKPGQTS